MILLYKVHGVLYNFPIMTRFSVVYYYLNISFSVKNTLNIYFP